MQGKVKNKNLTWGYNKYRMETLSSAGYSEISLRPRVGKLKVEKSVRV